MVDRLFSDTDLAALYDAWWPRAQRKDFDFYLPLVMSAEAVLDAGCGTGACCMRPASPVIRAGYAGSIRRLPC